VLLTVLDAALAQTLPSNAEAWEHSPSAAWMWPSGAVEGKGDVTMQTWVELRRLASKMWNGPGSFGKLL